MDSGRFSKKGTIGVIAINNLVIMAAITADKPDKILCLVSLTGMIILGSIFLIVQGHSDTKNGDKPQ